ncbi:hypothetical protein [Roseateles sp.]|uniref:hypothetical protein n=1 Tax=Roseateles sp. TaxID=1971397 RepID=UPI002E03C9AC|nr:hypothetical protein [Roseateles sp.]
MSGLDRLAGVLRLRPWAPRPGSVRNERPDWAGTLARGKSPAEVPGLLASLYSLCGHAHRLCAQMALQAVERGEAPADAAAARALQHETLCEHARRIGLDWPAALSPAAAGDASRSLQACPPLRSREADLRDARLWLQKHLLAMPAADWLRGWEASPAWWSDWSTAGHGWLPALVRDARAAADWPVAAAEPLHAHAGAVSLRQLAASLRGTPGFSRQPLWQDDCAETGCWTRLNDAARPLPATPWQRLGSRVAELVRLSLPDEPGRSGSGWLAFGALQVAPGEGLAWVEMARGLLVHHAALDGAGRVAAYQVLAPTEWNFHAEGAVAAALERLRPAHGAFAQRRIAALMAAYDPCVRFEVESQPMEEERAHA